MKTKTKLLDHQNKAFEKLKNIKVGALFMEMGTGKTRTAIELIKYRQNKYKNLIYFCPVSIKQTIKNEFIKHANINENDIFILDEQKEIDKNKFVYIVGIESISMSDRITLLMNSFISNEDFVILDESHLIKSYTSLRSKRLIELCKDTKYRLIMTGTPMSQGIVDLYTQMKFLHVSILNYNSFYSFASNHLEYSEKYHGMIIRSLNVDHITKKINPYTYQITKKECFDLPEKIYSNYRFNMSFEQREFYDYIKSYYLEELENNENIYTDKYWLFKLFGLLQQVVCGYCNFKDKKIFQTFEDKRIDILSEIIDSIQENEKIVIWHKYNNDIKNILSVVKDNYVLYNGKINKKQRDINLKQFETDKNIKFFIGNPSIGAYGLNELKHCSYVIFYNTDFVLSKRLQCEDRNHRLGIIKNVQYIDIICNNSIDERIHDSFIKKIDIIESFKSKLNNIKNNKQKKNTLKEFIENL